MNLFIRLFKLLQSEANALLYKFSDPIKLTEQGIRDLKKDFDEAMHNVAQVKAIATSAKKDLAQKQQIAAEYEQKALVLLKKGQSGELDPQEADRLAAEALKKKQSALQEVQALSENVKSYEVSLKNMENKVLELKNKIQQSENEYTSLKARATVAKTTKKINQQLSGAGADSTMAMLEEMKTKIQSEENLAEGYEEISSIETSVDDEINKAIGTDINIQNALDEMKQKLLANPDSNTNNNTETNTETNTEIPQASGDIEEMKKELEE